MAPLAVVAASDGPEHLAGSRIPKSTCRHVGVRGSGLVLEQLHGQARCSE
jgi:hypothetical protein